MTTIALDRVLSDVLLWSLCGAVYFAPFIVALCRRCQRTPAIFLTNLLGAWSVAGWGATLIWACLSTPRPRREGWSATDHTTRRGIVPPRVARARR